MDNNTLNLVIGIGQIIAVALIPLIVWWMGINYQNRKAKKDAKLSLFLNLMANRKGSTVTKEKVDSLNLIDVVFHECGNFDVMELAPTVQCLTGNVPEDPNLRPMFYDYVMNARKEQILINALQSEEGGRFYHEQNRNILVEADENFPLELPERYTWMTLRQIYNFLRLKYCTRANMACESNPEDELTEQREQRYKPAYNLCRFAVYAEPVEA